MVAKVYDVSEIRNKLNTNDKWLIRGLLAIYAKQTADERSSETTKHQNGVGFNGTDANILTSFAKQVLQWQTVSNPRYQSPLSPKQMSLLRRRMAKYASQLARIAEENNPVEDFTPSVKSVEVVSPKTWDEQYDEAVAEIDAYATSERDAIQEVENFDELMWNSPGKGI